MTFEISPIGQSDFEAVFALAVSSFATQSTLHAAVGISVEDYASYLRPSFQDMIDEGLSLKAIDNDNGTVLGAIIATDLVNCLSPSAPSDRRFRPIVALTQSLLQSYVENEALMAGAIALVDMGFTAPEARGSGIYNALRTTVHSHLASLGYQRVLGELSSAATQHVVLKKLGHRAVAQISFQEFEFEGAKPFDEITEPTEIILSEGILG